MTEPYRIRQARTTDSAVIAALLVEGFGHDYGGALLGKAGQRMLERIHALPGRLNGMFVAADTTDRPVGMAGLRTTELRPTTNWQEESIQLEELGIARAFWLELRADLTEPSNYQLRPDEAFVYSVVVTASWRRRGVAEALLQVLQQEAWSRGKRRIALEVVATNSAALRLYESHGYTLVRHRRGLLSLLRLGVPPRLLLARPLTNEVHSPPPSAAPR
ncbi:MAG: GNAT family N-acetyltransferase [Herpetosiphonaceae bacterium]|nr:GNAT family N-acetyltransferase [Herpetosiphonaceae bacterium]